MRPVDNYALCPPFLILQQWIPVQYSERQDLHQRVRDSARPFTVAELTGHTITLTLFLHTANKTFFLLFSAVLKYLKYGH